MNFIRTLKKIFKRPRKTRKTPPPLVEVDAVLVEPPIVSFILKAGPRIVGVYKTWKEASKMGQIHRGSKIIKVVNPITVEGRVYKKHETGAKFSLEVIG